MASKVVSENSDMYSVAFVCHRQALQLQLQPDDRIGSDKLTFGRLSTATKNAVILVNISDNLAKLRGTKATNVGSVQELNHRLEETLWNQTQPSSPLED